ncbi:MAG: 2-polyprenylphenol 6-hydroxylase [Alphaproteobacteria bacterium]|nr:2-polyprenylphenol 6-hydroxylase [Alphaproteobacteria bacterium]MBV9905372.1 2-polyprenylphenol 6-hydroxylase [Alphaproteobacteria bacterium]
MALRDYRRLWHAARVLARNDALFPKEYEALLPRSARIARRLLGSHHNKHDSSPPGVRLARALESLGPAYIKLGQVLATRPDIVGEDVALALAQLQDRLPPFPTAQAKAVIADALGKPAEVLYSALSEPVAAASIAQVHDGMTAGEHPVHVAVKVLRPNVAIEFARDIAAFRVAARLAERFIPAARRLRPIDAVETLAISVALELDLRMEAAGASELEERTRNDPDFRVPHVDWSRTSDRVLTTEWIEGIPVRDRDALIAAGHDPKRIANLVIRNFLIQALRDGYFHADMHQGNLFVDAEGRLVAVDFGIMGRLDDQMRRFMAETLAGFLQRDYRRVAQVHYDVAFVPPHHPVETFAQALRAIGEPIFGRTAKDVSMARLLQQLFDTTERFDMRAQPQLLLMQKTMMVVEGVARGLDPDFDIWEASRPVVEKWMIERLGPEGRLREAADSVSALGRVAQNLPQLLKNAETISAMVAEGGLKLHPESALLIAEAQLARTRHVRIAIWIAAFALGLLAVLAFVWRP